MLFCMGYFDIFSDASEGILQDLIEKMKFVI